MCNDTEIGQLGGLLSIFADKDTTGYVVDTMNGRVYVCMIGPSIEEAGENDKSRMHHVMKRKLLF